MLDAAQTYLKEALDDRPGISWNAVAFQGTEWLFLGALTPITYHMARRFPLQPGRWKRTLGAHLAGACVLCIGWATLGVALSRVLDTWLAQGELPRAYASWLLSTIPWSVFMYFAVLGCVQAFSCFSAAQERETHAARLTAQLAASRLNALRTQLNPHFLFNSLNAVTVLVREQNSRAAARMLELLGDMLRHVPQTDQPHQIPLAEELRFVEQYLAFEQIRLSDPLRVSWSLVRLKLIT